MAVEAIADTVGVMLAGAEEGATQAVRRGMSGELNPLERSRVAGGGRARPAIAALINGTAAHALDFDDNFHAATTHASAVLVPALLAVNEGNVSGERLVTAYLIGLEAQAAIGEGLNPSHYTAGWHSTSTVGCIGTAAATAWLLGLDKPRIAASMSIAVSMAGGPKGQFGTAVKPFHAGLAARNAVEAAQLAAGGVAGNIGILEDKQGYLELAGGTYARGWADLELGGVSILERVGLATKRYPCCGSSHRAIDMLLDLKAEYGFSDEDVQSMEVLVALAHARNLAFSEPRDEMEARFSMNYCLAVALAYGRLTLRDFTQEAVDRPEIRKLLGLTRMVTYSNVEERASKDRLPHELTVTLRDGRILRASKKAAKGTLADPLSDSDRQDKFLDCASPRLGMAAARDLYDRLMKLDGPSKIEFAEI